MFFALQQVDGRVWWPLILLLSLLVYAWFAQRQYKTYRAATEAQLQRSELIWESEQKAHMEAERFHRQVLDELSAIRNLLEKRN